mgnify:CR=1 FL=1
MAERRGLIGAMAALSIGAAMAAMAAMAASAAGAPPERKPAILVEAPRPPRKKRGSQKRKAKARAIVERNRRSSGSAKAYALARDFNPARSSTLRKVQKLLRLEAGR